MPKTLVVMAARGARSFPLEERQALARVAKVKFVAAPAQMNRAVFVEAFADADVAAWTPRGTPALDARVLSSLAVKAVALPTTGVEWIDVPLLLKRGIVVTNVPDFSSASCSELTIGLALMMMRSTPLALAGVARVGTELFGKTWGVIGAGNVGVRVLQAARGLGMSTLYADTVARHQAACTRVSLRALLERCDVVSVHCPLTEKTRGMLSARAFSAIRSPLWLVNTARPAIVDTAALGAALRRKLRGYAVDTGYLPPREIAALKKLPNVLVVPHVSWYTREAIERERRAWVSEMIALCRGRPKSRV